MATVAALRTSFERGPWYRRHVLRVLDGRHEADVRLLGRLVGGPGPLVGNDRAEASDAVRAALRDDLVVVAMVGGTSAVAVSLSPQDGGLTLGWGARDVSPLAAADVIHEVLSSIPPTSGTIRCWVTPGDDAGVVLGAIGFDRRRGAFPTPDAFEAGVLDLRRPSGQVLSDVTDDRGFDVSLVSSDHWRREVVDLREAFWTGDGGTGVGMVVGGGLTLHMAVPSDVARIALAVADLPETGDVERDVELGRYLVGRDMQGAVVTCVRVRQGERGSCKVEVATVPSERRSGHGTTMLRATSHVLYEKGAESIDTLVRCDDEVAAALCESSGMRIGSPSFANPWGGRSHVRVGYRTTFDEALEARATTPAP